jgi:sodium transport system permease protein
MSLKNIKLIFRREMRDQLRDRRTLFMILVLPVLFYPLLGISFFQIAQFLREHPSRVLIIGYESTGGALPELVKQDQFAQQLTENAKAGLVELKLISLLKIPFVREGKWPTSKELSETQVALVHKQIRRLMNRYRCEAAIFFPPNFFQELEEYPNRFRDHARIASQSRQAPPEVPKPVLLYDNSSDKKALAHARVDRVLKKWSAKVGQKSLEKSNLSQLAAQPIEFSQYDLAKKENRINTSLWSKILPFVLLIWAVTGAFYPAVDLCAGEKERGTLETLLTSPALRVEIVLGKLLTVTVFSFTTAILNLVAMAITGGIVMSQLKELATRADVGPPPFFSMIWLAIILIPVAALFSSVCLALAAFARSTKEGQYYLMPVILVTLPLILLPMAPSAELDLGFSLIPVSGIVLLMRAVMEGTINELWPYAFPVAAITLLCGYLGIRWAVDQFRREEVLFREGEQWNLTAWLKHLYRDRQLRPTFSLAILCGVLILVVKFFLNSAIDVPSNAAALEAVSFESFIIRAILTPMLVILSISLAMTFLLTKSPWRTLQLGLPKWLSVPAAALLALALFPLATACQLVVGKIYELPPQVHSLLEAVQKKLTESESIWVVLLLIALLPAVCEELAYRGFILSGLWRPGHRWRAILLSSLLFAVAHSIMQQQVNAFLLGLVLGYLAIQAGSIWPCIAYHFVHNTTTYLATDSGLLETILESDLYAGSAIFAGTLLAVVILFWFQTHQPGGDRNRQSPASIDRGTAHPLPG